MGMTNSDGNQGHERYYATALSLSGKRCVIIGGGAVAERKLLGLIEAGANDVLIVSPDLTEGLQQLVQLYPGCIEAAGRQYRENDLAEAWLVFVCTADRELNKGIALTAERLRIWCQVADQGATGSMVTPSTVRRGSLLLAVTASGASPALSIAIRRELERQYGPRYERDVERLRALRDYVLMQQSNDKVRRSILTLAAEEVMQRDTLIEQSGYMALAIETWYQKLLELTKESNHDE
ncbi:precorrin-2 dehydrogenase/sirohydrochlorin ferrochelatase family protein [Paenibacillus sp. strain BS8-2]